MEIKFTFNITQQSDQIFSRNCLECDADDIAHEFAHRIKETGNIGNQSGWLQQSRPKQLKVAFLQNVGQLDDFVDGLVLHFGGQQQALAQCEIGMRQIGEGFQ